MLGHSGTGYFSRKGGLSHPGFGMQCVEGPFLEQPATYMTYDLGDFRMAWRHSSDQGDHGWLGSLDRMSLPVGGTG